MKGRLRAERESRLRVLVLAGLIGTTSAYAETWRVTPSVTVAETFTDNVNLAPAASKQSDLITEVTPGLRIDGTGARLKLNFDYRMRNFLYANESARNHREHYLDALATLEAVENWLFVDAKGSITQQSISAFGARPTTSGNVNSNRAETSTYQLSPYIRGRLGAAADYQLRYNWTTSRANAIADTEISEVVGNVRGVTALTAFGWAIDGNSQSIYYGVGRDIESTRLRGSLIYHFDPQLRFSVTGGRESNNYASVNEESRTTFGAGVEWAPTERTQVSAFRERRFFGDGHAYSIRHRTPLTAWQYTDSKDITFLPNQLATAGPGTAFDLLFNALASRIPDPVARRQEVQRLLQQNAIPADLLLASNFLTTRATVTASRQGSVALIGVRNTVTFGVGFSEQQSLSVGAGIADDFNLSSTIRTRAITADWAHRLSGFSTLSVLASQMHTSGTAASGLESTQWLLSLLLSHQLGPRTFASASARLARFDGPGASDYSEKALTASLSITF